MKLPRMIIEKIMQVYERTSFKFTPGQLWVRSTVRPGNWEGVVIGLGVHQRQFFSALRKEFNGGLPENRDKSRAQP